MLCSVALACLVFASLTSYIKARAEGLGLTCNVGFAERSERLVIILPRRGIIVSEINVGAQLRLGRSWMQIVHIRARAMPVMREGCCLGRADPRGTVKS